MARNFHSLFFRKGLLTGALLFVISECPFAIEASDTLSDTLTQVAAIEVSFRPLLSPEIEASKQLLEQSTSSKNREQLYREIFGIPPPKPPRQIEASLTVNEKVDGKIEIVFSEDRTDFTLPASAVISMISEMISPELLNSVKAKIDKSGRLTKKELDGLGLETTFDSEDFHVHIAIPPELLSKQIHDLKGYREDPYIIECLKPNATSAFLNINANQKLKYMQTTSDDTTSVYYKLSKEANDQIRQPLSCNIDGAINIKGVVLEGSGSYRETDPNPVQKKDVRLVYDLPRQLLRFTAGDINYKTTGYLAYVPMVGLGVAKDYVLQPHVVSFPVSGREFFLKEQSEVNIWVNDVLVKTMVLEPGTHDIRGFPFASGSNKVKIEIKNFSGQNEILEFSYIYEPTLLAKGKSQYTCYAGLSSSIVKSEYVYNASDPYLLATYKRGLTSNFTFDAYGQGFKNRAIMGADGIYALSLGNVHLDVAGSYSKTTGVDCAARAGFFYRSKVAYSKNNKTRSQRINPVTWNIQAEYYGPDFPEQLDDSLEFYDERARFSTDLSIPMPGLFKVDLKSAFNIRPDTVNLFEFGVSIQKTLFKSLRLGANLNYLSDSKLNRANPSVSVNAQWTFLSGPNSFSINETVTREPPASTDTLVSSGTKDRKWGFNTGVQWDYIDMNQRPEKIDGGLIAMVNDEYSEYKGHIGYSGNGGSVEFYQNMATPGFVQGQLIQHQSDLTLKTTLVFVDGAVGLSRPVYDGFALVKGEKNLKGSKIRVNPNDAGYDATSVWYSPAVLPLHSPYLTQKIRTFPLNASVASVSENMDFTIFPQYKSGFLLSVGTDITVLVIGTLVDKNGKPLDYRSVTIMPEGDTLSQPVNTFTNQAGKFQFMGRAGQVYEIRLDGVTAAGSPIIISIPKDKNDIYRVGDIITDGIGSEVLKNDETTQTSVPDSSIARPAAVDSSDSAIVKWVVESELESSAADSGTPVNWVPSKDETAGDTVVIDPDDVIDDDLTKNLINRKARRAYILGTLKDSIGILPFTTFEVTSVSDSLQKPIRSFTNKDGKFQIICTKPTNYRISAVLNQKGDTILGSATFYVTAKSMGTYRHVGKLTLVPDSGTTMAGILSPDASIQVTGTLVDNEGHIMQYTPFSFISLDEVKSSFTNKDGSFQIICSRPGRYMIVVSGMKIGVGTLVTIPSGTKGRFDIGRQVVVPNPAAGQPK